MIPLAVMTSYAESVCGVLFAQKKIYASQNRFTLQIHTFS